MPSGYDRCLRMILDAFIFNVKLTAPSIQEVQTLVQRKVLCMRVEISYNATLIVMTAYLSVVRNDRPHKLHPHHTITVNSDCLCHLRAGINRRLKLSSRISNRKYIQYLL